MLNRIGEQWLQRLYEDAQISERATDVSEITPKRLCGIEGTFAQMSSFNLGWYEVLHNRDISQAKRYFFKSGKLACWLSNRCKKDSLTTGHALIAALLSDDADLIRVYANATNPTFEYMTTRSIAVFDKLAQLHLIEDMPAINQYMAVAHDKIVPRFKYSLPILEFFRSLEEKNVSHMEMHIKSMLAPKMHKYLNRDDRYSNLFSFPAVKYAKLAWMLGFKIDLDSSLVPDELLQIEPLPVYEDFPFLD